MPFQNRLQSKISARSMYAKNHQEVNVKKGRGRPRKHKQGLLTKEAPELSSKYNTTTVESQKLTKSKPYKEKMDSFSSEADFSSEGVELENTNPEKSSDKEMEKENRLVSDDEEDKDKDSNVEDDDDKVDKGYEEDEESNTDEENDMVNEKKKIAKKDIKISVVANDLDSVTTNTNLCGEKELSDDIDNNEENLQISFTEPKIVSPEIKNKGKSVLQMKINQKGLKRKLIVPALNNINDLNSQNDMKSDIQKKKKIKLEKSSSILQNQKSNSYDRYQSLKNTFPIRGSHSSYNHIQSTFRDSVPCGNIAAEEAFRWLLHPSTPEDFFRDLFEKTPFHLLRNEPSYYKELFDGNDLHTVIKENNLLYNVHIDVVKYENGQRIPLQADGKAYYSNVWDDYKEGYSVRVRNPQTYNKKLWNFCSLLQEYFSTSVGVNVYLTPPKAQGFPPHYDDIDAFIVQVEGKKFWKIYSPRCPSENLARYQSIDFKQDEIGKPYLEVWLQSGDMLYIPRGYIHQAYTSDTTHSLHLTFSSNQLNTWGDLLLLASKKAVEKAILNEVELRHSLPKDFMTYLGVSATECNSPVRSHLMKKMKYLAHKSMDYLDIDDAADLHALKFIQSSLPPVFNKIEKECSLHGNGSHWNNGTTISKGDITPITKIQLLRKRNIRLVIDDTGPKLFHNLENPMDPQSTENQEGVYVELDLEGVPAITYLLKKHPAFVKVEDLPFNDLEDKICFATLLYENGIIRTKVPLTHSADWSSTLFETPVKEETY